MTAQAAVPIRFAPRVYPWEKLGTEYPLKRPDLAPGMAEWIEDNDGVAVQLAFICPCGCSRVLTVPVYLGDVGRGWRWIGGREFPTLTPSIKTACGWHGWLRNGIFRAAIG